jgi:hypothetical protein
MNPNQQSGPKGSDPARYGDPTVAPVLTSIRGAQSLLSLSRSSVWLLVSNGEIESFNIGKRRLITIDSIHQLIERRLKKAGGTPQQPVSVMDGRARPGGRKTSQAA